MKCEIKENMTLLFFIWFSILLSFLPLFFSLFLHSLTSLLYLLSSYPSNPFFTHLFLHSLTVSFYFLHLSFLPSLRSFLTHSFTPPNKLNITLTDVIYFLSSFLPSFLSFLTHSITPPKQLSTTLTDVKERATEATVWGARRKACILVATDGSRSKLDRDIWIPASANDGDDTIMGS